MTSKLTNLSSHSAIDPKLDRIFSDLMSLLPLRNKIIWWQTSSHQGKSACEHWNNTSILIP
jgi:hypothetical protein